ncbi:MAG TPA: 16S rRNA (cytidine(1402)-2'-O)-methyltransferase [Lachnospiraceae bacterium]|nr:16S rRNA (cytidine(1402)-2'-O)-methyltransferase [Lachnospiraceae bacterium]
MSGILYLVATPIGNLEDMTFRAVRVLKEADLIAAEDTRNSIKLLNHFEIRTPMTSYHEFNKYDKADRLIEKLSEGQTVALITDAGTPGISDPGEVLVEKCYEAGITVIPVPGACAAVNALIASGQPTRRFAFEAFLPADKKERRAVIQELKNETRTIVLYEAPHRLVKTLKELRENLGDRELTLCKELTKKHESFARTTLDEAISAFEDEDNAPRGEYVLVIKGKSEEAVEAEKAAAWENISVTEHVEMYITGGMTKKDAIKQVALDRNLPKREVYAEVERIS